MFVGMFVGSDGQPLDAIPEVDPAKQGVSATQLAALDALAHRYVEEGRVAGMVNVVIRNGEIVYYKATGPRHTDGRALLKSTDLFRVYSMTKPITAVAAMQLLAQGKFHLSNSIEKFVPELAGINVLDEQGLLVDTETPVTMHQLLNHTAGFSYGFVPLTDPVDALKVQADLWAAKDLDEFARRVVKLPLKFQPGTKYNYSIAEDLTGLVVQR